MEGIRFENENQRSSFWLGRPTCSYFGVPAGHAALTTRAASVRAAREFWQLGCKKQQRNQLKTAVILLFARLIK